MWTVPNIHSLITVLQVVCCWDVNCTKHSFTNYGLADCVLLRCELYQTFIHELQSCRLCAVEMWTVPNIKSLITVLQIVCCWDVNCTKHSFTNCNLADCALARCSPYQTHRPRGSDCGFPRQPPAHRGHADHQRPCTRVTVPGKAVPLSSASPHPGLCFIYTHHKNKQSSDDWTGCSCSV